MSVPEALFLPTSDEATASSAITVILESIAEAIFVLDRAWRFVFVNPQAEVLLRLPRAALLGTPIWEAFPDESGAEFGRRCQRALATGIAATFEIYSDTLATWIEVRLYPSMVGLAVYCQDIAARKLAEAALRDSARRDRILLEQAADGFLIADGPGNVIEVNARLCDMLGYRPEDLLGRPFVRLIHPDDLGARPLQIAQLLAGDVILVERRWRRRDGTFLPVETNSRMLLDRRVQIIMRDISERKAAEAALEASEARYQQLLEQASDGIFVIDRDGRFVEVNARACTMMGYARAELLGMTSRDLIVPADLRARPMVEPEGTAVFLDERMLRRKDGTTFAGEASVVRLPDGRQQAIVRDVSERKRLEARLTHQAFHDPLTGLPNRALFLDRLDHALACAHRGMGGACAVLFLDLDRFKDVNDSLGHAVGDQLLILVAARLRAVLREADTLARFGGDEFALLLEDVTGLDEAVRTGERLLAALSSPLPVSERELAVTASIGLALSTGAADTPADLLRFADVALYRAKEAGRACCEVFYPGMNREALARLELERDLRGAVERGEIAVNYQPTVDLATGRVVGLEALARWHHPARGMVPPGDFIPLAEETGLIVSLGRWVMRRACHQLAAWRARYPGIAVPVLAVNLSPRQFRQPNLADDVAGILAETGLPAGLLRLEITETVAMTWPEATITALSALRALGVGLALDDFGTGYSSLARLQHLPVDALKVDRSFFAGGERNHTILKAVVDLGHGLGLEALAEGLETAAQVAWARGAGFDRGQGYYFSPPLRAAEVEALWVAGLTFDLPSDPAPDVPPRVAPNQAAVGSLPA